MNTPSASILNNKIVFTYLCAIIICAVTVHFLPQLDFIAAWQEPENTITVKVFQFCSDSVSFFSFGIPLIITIVNEFKKEANKKRNRLSLLYIVLSIAIGGLISWVIKKSFAEPRPYEVDPRIIQLSVGGGYSLPSGHTTEAFASAIALAVLFTRWDLLIPIFAWALLVATSRIYLGVHYPFDIFVGMFIGSSSAILLYRFLFQRLLKAKASE